MGLPYDASIASSTPKGGPRMSRGVNVTRLIPNQLLRHSGWRRSPFDAHVGTLLLQRLHALLRDVAVV